MKHIYPNKDSIVFWNGAFVKASEVEVGLLSQTLHYGNGVFEGLRSYETVDGVRIFRSREHYRRLRKSAERMHLPFSYTPEKLTLYTYELLEKNNLTEAYIRPLLFVDNDLTLISNQHSNILISAWNWGKLLGDKKLNLMVSSYTRPDPRSLYIDAKVCGHYVNNILATTDARRKGFDDAILLDVEGYISTGAAASIFYEKNEVLYTPIESKIFPSITRNVIIELAEKMGIKVVQKDTSLDEFLEADGAFFTGTATEVVAIGTVNKKSFKMDWEDTLGHMLSRKYRKLVTRGDNYQQTVI